VLDPNIDEAVFATATRERVRLRFGPAVARVAVRTGHRPPFDRDEPSTGAEDPARLPEPRVEIAPVMHRGDRPHGRRGVVGDGERLGRAVDVPHVLGVSRQQPRDAQHDRCRIHSGHVRAETGRVPRRDTGTAPDVDHHVTGPDTAQPGDQLCVAPVAHDHAERSHEAPETRESGMVAMVVGGRVVFDHRPTLTVEPDFKSSGKVPDLLLTIGEVAERAHVTTSTIRYYERRGLLVADARKSGQRRYRVATLRRLVFIGMLQDAGLALDDIDGILNATTVSEWKAIAAGRLDVLDEQIANLNQARAYLAGALLCRYDHPATDCKIMTMEIDRRLADADHTERH
jgi:DNA-binding transcriptional MerR regulator